ncbi:similar to RIKEN cDNA 5830433M19, isoform CRA_b [Rattus norvegicus]|uniref:Caspase activity and apoptosis inhibitor 1 n=4 Tax=Rattus norvegicus TaxID=10116 RepID=G3V6Y7_RAT|nr:caspase activity and apoptosis inhibitor 1 isoform 1 [Rattus norvegicus]EDL97754.1 similar to RIKEN cDNA 5830433M19, isoform CRA_b [Rattus norvegicus]|eukprot:XP_006238462.1 PREDICTED: caspase activity and apoptosis inhibitor 1 isoform X1 [Rattus norvegicus]
MTGKKSSREKRRKRSGQEAAAALAAPDLVPVLSGSAGGCGSVGCCGVAGGGTSVAGGAERSERRKRRSTDSSSSVSGSLQQETKYLLPSLEKELILAEHSDLEEGGLDLTVSLKPVSFYISDKKEMLQQCFCIIGEQKLQKMLPDVLKNCSVEEIKKLCQEQLELLSEKKILKILEGDNGLDSDMEEEADRGSKVAPDLISQQDTCVDSTSSLRENKQPEGLESKQGKGEDSDVLSINADAYDSDIEGPSNEEAAASATAAPTATAVATAASASEVPGGTVQSEAAQIDDLERDIEKSVNEILGLVESSPKEPKAAILTVPPPEDVQPSAQQLELLELEMRARAIKALMKAGDIKKPV